MTKKTIMGKIAIVTGASSGIGKATALAFAQRGASVVLAARNTPALEHVAGEIRALGQESLVITTDVTQQCQVDRMVQETLSRWGRIDILVANAGEYIRAPITELTVQLMERSMAVNFYGGLYAVLAVLPYMRREGSGHIVLVSSMDAKKPTPPDAPYAAAKCALSGFGEILRQELRGSGVYSTTIFPGRVDTPMIEGLNFPFISAKIPAAAVARAIVGSIEYRKAEILLPARIRWLYYMSIFIHIFSPSLEDRATRFLRFEGWEKQGG